MREIENGGEIRVEFMYRLRSMCFREGGVVSCRSRRESRGIREREAC